MHTTGLITKISARFKGRSRIIRLLLFSSIISISALSAQTTEGYAIGSVFKECPAPDTPIAPSLHLLPEFTIREVRFEQTGYAIWKADSLPQYGIQSVSERLIWSNVLDVRANAPGTLATLSLRGAGPSRTPVFWNGLNLQSPMNGVVDAALLPLWPDDQLEVRYGGQSAAQSSGAMAGSVAITQGKQNFSEGFSGFVNVASGSYGHWEGGAGAGFSGTKTASKIRANWQQSQNNFPFQKQGLDGRFYPSRQINNFVERVDLQQFNRIKVNEKNTLTTAFWFQSAFREIPPAITESPSDTWQRDQSNRAVVTWEHAPDGKKLWTTRAAWLQDYLAYHQPGDTDTSRSRQALISTERSARLGKTVSWRAGGVALRQWAMVDGYSDSTRWFGQTRVAGYLMGAWQKKDTRFSALVRQEWAEAQAAPLTASLGAQIRLGRVGELKGHFSRNFNLPTLNDRFWKGLGKPNLRPEKGYSADLSWALLRPGFSLELTGFQLLLDDWILWQPDSTGLFRPENLRKVWSRGLEIASNSSFALHRFLIKISGKAQFSKTTNIAVYGGSESVLGKQLPYTPKMSGGWSLRVSRGIFSAAFLQQFTAERFDQVGNRIPAFQTGNILFDCTLWKRRLTIDFRIENLWNTRYEIIRYRPMPGRSWRMGLGYKW